MEDFTIHKIIYGTSNNFTSIWAEPKASLTSGKFYVGEGGTIDTNATEPGTLVEHGYWIEVV